MAEPFDRWPDLHFWYHHCKRTFGQKDCTWGERGRYVKAQAFSFLTITLRFLWPSPTHPVFFMHMVWRFLFQQDSWLQIPNYVSMNGLVWCKKCPIYSLCFMVAQHLTFLCTSRVSGQGNRIGPVHLCVCLSVLSRLNCWTYGLNIWYTSVPRLSVRQRSHSLTIWRPNIMWRHLCPSITAKRFWAKGLRITIHRMCVNTGAFSVEENI